MADVTIILGSPGDAAWARRIADALDGYGVTAEVRIASAHKTPSYLLELLAEREREGGAHLYITVAGRSNALSGFVDANVTAPVIACPPAGEAFGGMDILSSLRMPSGVAPLVVLEPENAALAAVKILALGLPDLAGQVARAQQAGRERVTDADAALRQEPATPGTGS